MMRGLIVFLSLWLLLALAHHGEGRVLTSDMFNLQREKSMEEAVGVSISRGNHYGATPKSVPCTWVCGEGNTHNFECTCVPDALKKGEVVEAEKTIAAHVEAPKAVPCTWVCGEGNTHNYECTCIPDVLKKDEVMEEKNVEVMEAEKTTAAHVTAHKPVPCTWVCGEGLTHNYECNCIPNVIMEDEFLGAPENAPVGEHL